MVATMTQALQLRGQERVLEVGTGSGYQTTILSRLVTQVYSVERYPQLAWALTLLYVGVGWLFFFYPVGRSLEMIRLLLGGK